MTVLPAFVYFSHLNEQTAIAVEKVIRKALQGHDASEVSYAAIALQKWMELSGAADSSQIKGLTSRLIAIIESGRTVGLQQLLWVAGELFKKQTLSEDQIGTGAEIPQTSLAMMAAKPAAVPAAPETPSPASGAVICQFLLRVITPSWLNFIHVC